MLSGDNMEMPEKITILDTEYIRADLVPQWQPIETAPKDGTELIILNHDKALHHAISNECGFISISSGSFLSPTHWMPLPKAPE